jgi:pimeloyl-ACP methyl ester carboxylesterase
MVKQFMVEIGRSCVMFPGSIPPRKGALLRNLITAILLAGLLVSAGPLEALEVALDTGTGTQQGTLLLPADRDTCPVVLIIAGSGPTDRDGNSALVPGRNNSLKQLAEGLADRGVASLRYDKRGVAASRQAGFSEEEVRFGHYIDDAARWCAFLQADQRFTSLTVAGHSEGAQIGANAAWLSGADGLVSLAGAGRPIFAILREQLQGQLSGRSKVRAEAVMQSLERGQLVPDPPQELAMLFRTSAQPYLISWLRYDPAVDIARFDCPVAIVQGTTDVQVSLEDAERLASAQPRARLVLLEGLNHIFKPVEAPQRIAHHMSLGDSTLVLGPEVIKVVAGVARQADRYHRQKTEALRRVKQVNPVSVPGGDGAWAEAAGLPSAARRTGFWARRFLQQGAQYRFGLAEGGYAEQGLLVLDDAMDCVSFMYRCTELARSADGDQALLWALRMRFAGAPLDTLVDARGRVDYDRPEHLDYSLDMVRTGIWGRDVTLQLSGAVPDTLGSSRYGPDSFHFVPEADLDPGELAEGDVVWLVLDPAHEQARRLRDEHGLVIGHLGIIIIENGTAWLAHAASSPLEGHYDRPGLVKVPLHDYLRKVDRYAGVIVTRP